VAVLSNPERNDDGGFTLIELLVVIIIIGILAAIAIPVFLNQRNKGYDAQAKSDLRNVASLEESYLIDKQAYAPAADSAAAVATLGYSPSTNVTDLVVAVDSGGTSEFCAKAISQSGKSFWYDNQSSGVTGTQPTPATAGFTCP
jgi:type IV pilus assembly protein PilA